jgi:UDP-N-acetylglucosamine 2-epimerase
MKCKLAYIEAGLRCYDLLMPEEHNRRITDHVSDLPFAPTPFNLQTLRREMVQGSIHAVGNTVIDALDSYWRRVEQQTLPVE